MTIGPPYSYKGGGRRFWYDPVKVAAFSPTKINLRQKDSTRRSGREGQRSEHMLNYR